jgi:hypothetical protein
MSDDTPEPTPETTSEPGPDAPVSAEPAAPAGFWQRRGADVGLGILAVYVVLLAIGTAAEWFDIQWILDLPIY